jgi:hypothetical protein
MSTHTTAAGLMGILLLAHHSQWKVGYMEKKNRLIDLKQTSYG